MRFLSDGLMNPGFFLLQSLMRILGLQYSPLGRIESESYQSENQGTMKKKYITAAEFDERFDAGEDLSVHYDLEHAVRPDLEQRRVSVDFPVWMVQKLDRVARRLGVTRQSVIKVFISEKLKEESL